MIPYLGCEAAREMLHALVDGELLIADQVALESHLRWCNTCGARVEDLRLIGAALRLGSPLTVNAADAARLAISESEILTRIHTERAESIGERCRTLCTDARYVWPAIGATAALLVCLLGVIGVHNVARVELPDSMADRIAALANPGSDRNPLRLDTLMLAPRVLPHDPPALDSIPEDEAVFALATVITREGRVAGYELLPSAHDRNAMQSDEVMRVLDVVKHARFTPARTVDGAVAVNVVWVLARTTVKAQTEAGDFGMLPPVPAVEHATKPFSAGLERRPALRPASS